MGLHSGVRHVRWAPALAAAGFLCVAVCAPASGQTSEQAPDGDSGSESKAGQVAFGQVTNLPLPRFVSLKAKPANVRRGPSRRHRVDWELLKAGIPLEIVAEYGLWRQIRTWGEVSGWIYFSVLTGTRTIVVTSPSTTMRSSPRDDGQIVAIVQQDVVGQLESCELTWCEVRVDGRAGWINKSDMWGTRPDEVFE